jgi:ATP-dependent RNA helicase DHX36
VALAQEELESSASIYGEDFHVLEEACAPPGVALDGDKDGVFPVQGCVWRHVQFSFSPSGALAQVLEGGSTSSARLTLHYVYLAWGAGTSSPPPASTLPLLYPNSLPQMWVTGECAPPGARLNLALHFLQEALSKRGALAREGTPPTPLFFALESEWLKVEDLHARARRPPVAPVPPRVPRARAAAAAAAAASSSSSVSSGGATSNPAAHRGSRSTTGSTSTSATSTRAALSASSSTRAPPHGSSRGPPRLSPAAQARAAALSDALSSRAAARAAQVSSSPHCAAARMQGVRSRLPAAGFKGAVLGALAGSQVVLVSGGTGCGKSTQVPQFILEAEIAAGRGGQCRIICTQPRRIAAVGVAGRVAAERGEECGGTVGYHIKGDRRAGPDTCLTFVTTGVLLRQLVHGLGSATHIVVDEVHERGVETDFLLAILKRCLLHRPDVKVVLMSATMNEGVFAQYFAPVVQRGGEGRGGSSGGKGAAAAAPASGVPCIAIPGFVHPVQDMYLEAVLEGTGYRPVGAGVKELSSAAAAAAAAAVPGTGASSSSSSSSSKPGLDLRGWKSRGLDFACIASTLHGILSGKLPGVPSTGAILVFLPGVGEIRRARRELEQSGDCSGAHILELHGSQPPGEQQLVFLPPPQGRRKLVLSTNVAETSITIDDVTVVVDTCRVKESQYDALNGMSKLVETWASTAAMQQRRGRAGRVQPGVCYRLCPARMVETLEAHQTPEIARCALEELILALLQLNLGMSVEEFCAGLLTPPPALALRASLSHLRDMGAITASARAPADVELTPLGVHLARLNIAPHLGKALLFGAMLQCLDPVLSIAAALADRSPFVSTANSDAPDARGAFAAGGAQSDHLATAAAFAAWRATPARDRRDFAARHGLNNETLRGMGETRREWVRALSDMGFLPSAGSASASASGGGASGDARWRSAAVAAAAAAAAASADAGATCLAVNWASVHTNVVRAALAAGFSPRIVKVVAPDRTYAETSSGSVRRVFSAEDLRLYTLHPAEDTEGLALSARLAAAEVARLKARAARYGRAGGASGSGSGSGAAGKGDDDDEEDEEEDEDEGAGGEEQEGEIAGMPASESRNWMEWADPSSSGGGSGGKALTTRFSMWKGFRQDRVFVHPGSFNFTVGEYQSPWLVYHEKVATSKVRGCRRSHAIVPAPAFYPRLTLPHFPLPPPPHRSLSVTAPWCPPMRWCCLVGHCWCAMGAPRACWWASRGGWSSRQSLAWACWPRASGRALLPCWRQRWSTQRWTSPSPPSLPPYTACSMAMATEGAQWESYFSLVVVGEPPSCTGKR